MFQGAFGAAATALLALAFGEPLPGLPPALACSRLATGYGLSLRFYLLAQRAFGAARTGWTLAAAVAMVPGIVLHLAESHSHDHEHEALEREHAHSHVDRRHLHRHDTTPVGTHTHLHRHEPMRHAHPHVPDEHHAHQH